MSEYENEGCGDMAQELKDMRKERDAEIPMPKETTTDKLMSPGKGKVDG